MAEGGGVCVRRDRGERDVVGDWAAVEGEKGSSGSWLFHTSQCKALYMWVGRLLGWRWRAVQVGVILTTSAADAVGQTGDEAERWA